MSFTIDYEQYCVIGDPIYHSISPFIHKTIFNYFNERNKIYSKLKITSEGLVYNFSLLKSNFKGFNVTSPHKINILKYLDETDEFSKKVGCINTVKIINGKSIGYNTDFCGFLKGLREYKEKVKDEDILVLGSGGASRTVIGALIELGANVSVGARDFEKLTSLKKFIKDTYEYDIDISPLDKVQGTYFGIINTTSAIGHFSTTNLNIQGFCYDLNYSINKTTDFLGRFLGGECELIDGKDMLFYQAIKSQEIWRDEGFDENDISNIYSKFIEIFSED